MNSHTSDNHKIHGIPSHAVNSSAHFTRYFSSDSSITPFTPDDNIDLTTILDPGYSLSKFSTEIPVYPHRDLQETRPQVPTQQNNSSDNPLRFNIDNQCHQPHTFSSSMKRSSRGRHPNSPKAFMKKARHYLYNLFLYLENNYSSKRSIIFLLSLCAVFFLALIVLLRLIANTDFLPSAPIQTRTSSYSLRTRFSSSSSFFSSSSTSSLKSQFEPIQDSEDDDVLWRNSKNSFPGTIPKIQWPSLTRCVEFNDALDLNLSHLIGTHFQCSPSHKAPCDGRPQIVRIHQQPISELTQKHANDADLDTQGLDSTQNYHTLHLFSQNLSRSLQWNDIMVIVFSHESRRDFLLAQLHTWISRLDQNVSVVIASSQGMHITQEISSLSNIHMIPYAGPSGYSMIDLKVKYVFDYVEAHFPPKAYYIKVDDDTMVIPQNLFKFLQHLNFISRPDAPLYFGKANCVNKTNMYATDGQNYCHAAGACYGLNYVALHRFNQLQQQSGCGYWNSLFYGRSTGRKRSSKSHPTDPPASALPSGVKTTTTTRLGTQFEASSDAETNLSPSEDDHLDNKHYEDVMVARCLREATKATVIACESFFPQNPIAYFQYDKGGQIKKRLGKNPISFHHLSPSAMVYLDKFFYLEKVGFHIRSNITFALRDGHMKELLKKCKKQDKLMHCKV